MKVCSKCGEEKPLEAFYPSKKRPGGYTSQCKGCLDGLPYNWRNKLLPRRSHHWRRYGLTEVEYEAMFERQGGKCLICGQFSSTRRLAVDHDHATGKIRGLLCGRCNTLIGLAGDDIKRLKRAAHYLRQHQPA